ncbi:hypothetical protein TWF281_009181 [Arthrobotrys megalospora]
MDAIKSVIDLLHNSSLIIDDIEDSSPLRRGNPSTHMVFGTPQAINSANYLFVKSLGEVMKLGPSAVAIYQEELRRLHIGQSLDLHWTFHAQCPTEQEYMQMIDGKTGGLLRMACRLMKDQATKNRDLDLEDLLNIISRFFQIRDDYQNLQSTEYSTAKGDLSDLDEGKYSFMLIHALNHSKDKQLQSLIHLRSRQPDGKLSPEQKLLIMKIMARSKSLEYTGNVLAELQLKVREKLEAIEAAGREKNLELGVTHAIHFELYSNINSRIEPTICIPSERKCSAPPPSSHDQRQYYGAGNHEGLLAKPTAAAHPDGTNESDSDKPALEYKGWRAGLQMWNSTPPEYFARWNSWNPKERLGDASSLTLNDTILHEYWRTQARTKASRGKKEPVPPLKAEPFPPNDDNYAEHISRRIPEDLADAWPDESFSKEYKREREMKLIRLAKDCLNTEIQILLLGPSLRMLERNWADPEDAQGTWDRLTSPSSFRRKITKRELNLLFEAFPPHFVLRRGEYLNIAQHDHELFADSHRPSSVHSVYRWLLARSSKTGNLTVFEELVKLMNQGQHDSK